MRSVVWAAVAKWILWHRITQVRLYTRYNLSPIHAFYMLGY